MGLEVRFILIITIISIILSHISYAYATHTSIPVLESLDYYIAGNEYDLHGVILYNNQPTGDVLVEVNIMAPDNSMIREYVRSSSDGSFRLRFMPEIPGYYTVTVTSQCRDVHRDICTYQSSSMQILVLEELKKDICIDDGECIGELYARTLSASIDDATLYPDEKMLRLRLNASSNNNVYILLFIPREIIDSSDSLIIRTDDSSIEYKESVDDNFRVLEITFEQSPNSIQIDIIGTYAVPEFGYPIIILIISTLALLITNRRYLLNHLTII